MSVEDGKRVSEDLADIFGYMYPLMFLTHDEIASALPTEEEKRTWRDEAKQNHQMEAYLLAKRGKEKILAAFGGQEAIIELGKRRHEEAQERAKVIERARAAKAGGE